MIYISDGQDKQFVHLVAHDASITTVEVSHRVSNLQIYGSAP